MVAVEAAMGRDVEHGRAQRGQPFPQTDGIGLLTQQALGGISALSQVAPDLLDFLTGSGQIRKAAPSRNVADAEPTPGEVDPPPGGRMNRGAKAGLNPAILAEPAGAAGPLGEAFDPMMVKVAVEEGEPWACGQDEPGERRGEGSRIEPALPRRTLPDRRPGSIRPSRQPRTRTGWVESSPRGTGNRRGPFPPPEPGRTPVAPRCPCAGS